ncbi:MAG: 5-methyltetrahydropteroyltriglutamate--homocysteine methyltransferase [Acidiferrobacteraceae bacterium]|jgi:5-methyltetrahydropteroyltriglutamate--homocysteine methyltransferase|nr:5-methyltetrahydropteroyltriglutamate--homocysteine methyltransferase [Acidiferrobacteraceae bacterium]|tara:strand:- start:3099 stop:4151 length:1053 start_codon:yes stop_codon:yes gene_type:complete
MIRTTCIGAYPKPDFVELPDWFTTAEGTDTSDPTGLWAKAMAAMGEDTEAILSRGVAQVMADQETAGIDIPTDGEVPRENYIHYHCRHLEGIDFSGLTEKSLRNGAYVARLPTIRSRIRPRDRFLASDWRRAQAFTKRPVKITMPGPMTIGDTTADAHYGDPKRRGAELADALNVELRDLADAGCLHIQIDEPLFARKPLEALDYGFENLERAFHKCPAGVMRTVHMCCGYPDRLDNPDYPKADPRSYAELASSIEDTSIDVVSLEDAHCHNDLSFLEHFQKTRVILGVVAVAKSVVEPVEQIQARLQAALAHIDMERLIAAPDCGLGLLGRDLARAKLANLCEAARTFR